MKKFFKSFFSLGLIQVFGLLTPLILTPYIILKVGLSVFGIIATAQSIIVFFNLITEFGFNTTTVRNLSQQKDNHAESEKIVTTVFYLKLILLFIAFGVYFALIYWVPNFKNHFGIFLFSFSMVIGQTLLPIWYYQGTEKISKTTIPILIFKLLSIALIFICIKKPEDALYVNLIYGFCNLCAGVYLYIYIFKNYNFSLKYVHFSNIVNELKENMAMFLSNVSIVAYANSTIIILSFFISPVALGIYGVIDKILQLMKSVLVLVHNSVYPMICNIVKFEKETLIGFLKKIYFILWILVFSGAVFLYFFPNLILGYFIDNPSEGSNYLKYLGFLIFIVSLNMPFNQSLLALKKDWLVLRVVFFSSIISLLLNFLIVPKFGINGSILTMFVTETIVTCSFIYCFLKTDLIKIQK